MCVEDFSSDVAGLSLRSFAEPLIILVAELLQLAGTSSRVRYSNCRVVASSTTLD